MTLVCVAFVLVVVIRVLQVERLTKAANLLQVILHVRRLIVFFCQLS
jgi:hypothetical protein